MAKYIKKKDLKNAIDECTWYHIGKGGELVEGANSAEHEPLYKYSDIKKIIKGLPTRKFTDEPQTYITEDRDTQILDAWQVYHRSTTSVEDEPQTEYDKYREKIKAHDPHKYGFEDEPQTERSE